ncbi:uncharacterized protein LOC133867853 isoform X2 [Alnus glutinosa]|uniref:uncharacterized protein LOC133867853 isoform X2 n=1 Tax=Alnus glutinosa TaxID=3517 RepID=UPI002D796AAC|nr:uncharacterized protein LOC133867853 isoform X2 [Alnus glutinosa]
MASSSTPATVNQDNMGISKPTNQADLANQSKNDKGNDNANMPGEKPGFDSESKSSPTVLDICKDTIPAVMESLETLAQSKDIDKSTGDLANKLRNDLTYIRNSLKLEDNSNTLEQRIKKFEAHSNVLVDALKQGSEFEDSVTKRQAEGKQLQDKLKLLNKVVKMLKHQISSSKKLSPTDSETWYKDIDINEFHYSQVLDILPVLHVDKEFGNSLAFRDFRLVYDKLPDSRIKLCLLCFALIPENEIVKKRFMTYWWVGEGFISPQGEKADDGTDTFLSVEEVADRIFKELANKDCIEPVNEKHRFVVDSYKMNPFIRSAVILLAKEARFFDFDDKKGNPSANFKTSYRACLVNGFSQELVKSGSESDTEKLQVIFNVNEPYPDVFNLEWFSKFKNVKVLYLGRWQTSAKHHIEVESTDFLAGLKSTKLLRFLSLQGVSRITKLPHFVCKLSNLMILDLRACHNLDALPDWIGALRKLTHLDISECYLLDYMPKGICDLSELQVLKGFVISNGNSSRKNCTLVDLVKLHKLRKLSIYINTRDLDVCPLLEFNALQKLTITWGAGAFDQTKAEKNKGGAQPIMTATTPTPKNSGGNKNQDKGVPQSKAATTESPQMSEDAVKQEDGVAQPMAESSMNPENGGDNRKQDRGSGQPISATTTSSKNVGDKKTQDLGVAQPMSVTTTSSNIVGDKKTQDVGVAQPIAATAKSQHVSEDERKQNKGLAQPKTATTTTPKNCWGNKKQDKAVAHPMTDRVFKKLEKLDLKCYPFMTAPNWLLHKKLPKLEKLYIRGGYLQNLSLVQDQNDKWPNVKVLRLKFLSDFKMDWKKLRSSFPDLSYLEIFECPKLTYVPCNEKGVIRLRP